MKSFAVNLLRCKKCVRLREWCGCRKVFVDKISDEDYRELLAKYNSVEQDKEYLPEYDGDYLKYKGKKFER